MLNPGQFERRVGALGTAAILGAFVFFAALGYWQVFRTDLAERETNPRLLRQFADPNRGRILDRDGNVLAESDAQGKRRYPDASVAQVVGYIDARFGSQGAELAFNRELSGEKGASWAAALNAEFQRQGNKGLDVRLTIDSRVQAAAAAALGARKGAVVAIDPRNGEVLAMVSVPTYDPGALTEALQQDPSSPLLNRATQGVYPPGSTFKTVTASAALENGAIQQDSIVECRNEKVFDGFPVSCRNVPQGEGRYPFRNAYAFSVNAIFAEVGVKLGWQALLQTASKFGFGKPLPFTLDTAPTQVVGAGSELTVPLLASTAFGQGELLATPLQMAVVAATVANGGVLVQPHLGLAAYDGERKVIDPLEPAPQRRVLDAGVAQTMRDMMVAVVDSGQANGVQIQGIKVGGKTGTAESGRGTSHAWFIAFAPAENPTIAVAVLVEDGGQGGVVASPIAGQVIRAAVGR